MPRAFRITTVLLAVAALAASAADADEPAKADGTWRVVLRQQLKQEKGCDLNEILMYQEIPLGDSVALDGRSSCIDGREFNFSRKRPHQKFTIELCEPTVC